MSKKNLFAGILTALLFSSFVIVKTIDDPSKSSANEIPEEVNSIIQNKCFGCHNTDSKNDKAKEKLDFKVFDSLSGSDKVHILGDMGDVLKDEKMPPKKILDRFPDRALTDEEREILMKWAKKEAISIIKN